LRFGDLQTFAALIARAATMADPRRRAATLDLCQRGAGLGVEVRLGTALIAFIMASIVVTLGPLPLGLGSFEVTSTATLHLLGVPVEAAFAGTMLLRLRPYGSRLCPA
jgi:uncharacterized membrane protein YbhN (UPF0104 family)